MTVEATTDTPAVLVVSASELNGRTGKLLRELAAGTVVRIDNVTLGQTVGWLSAEPPPSVAGVAGLPEPGSARDAV